MYVWSFCRHIASGKRDSTNSCSGIQKRAILSTAVEEGETKSKPTKTKATKGKSDDEASTSKSVKSDDDDE